MKFALLAVISVFVFYLLNKKYRIGYLALISCGFIYTFNNYLLVYVVAYSLLNFYIGILIASSKYKIGFFRAGIIFNLTQLIILKYASFTIDPVFQIFNSDVRISRLSEILITVGVSYFTLQGIGYLINVKMGWEKPERSFLSFLLYIIFFPKFISGPIERSNHFLPQLKNLNAFNQQFVTEGFRLILLGFTKKVVIANQLGLVVNPVYNELNGAGSGLVLAGILIQPLYLYFDFSGYTDIAIGTARLFGIKIIPNFDRPFFAENVTTFWKRFHTSLSSWFNDYVFKQLSFRLRKWKSHAATFAAFITWILFGIWHGAGWNFMILGLLQALAINFEFFTKKWRQSVFSRVPEIWGKWIGRIITYIFYGLSLVFFFSPDLKTAMLLFGRLPHKSLSIPTVEAPFILTDKVAFFTAIGILIILLTIEFLSCEMKSKYEKMKAFWSSDKSASVIFRAIVYYAVILLVFYFGRTQVEFVYFQF